MSNLRFMSGGGLNIRFGELVEHAGEYEQVHKLGYDTVANGAAEHVWTRPGEVLAKLRGGNAYDFSRYVAGPRREVAQYVLDYYKLKLLNDERLPYFDSTLRKQVEQAAAETA